MKTEIISLAIQSLVSFLFIWFIIGQYRRYRVASFRQSLFEIRDKLFNYALEGHIDFNHPAYGMLRSMINGFIRFGHQISLMEIICFLVLTRKQDKTEVLNSFAKRWFLAMNSLDQNTKSELLALLFSVHLIVATHSLGYIVDVVIFGARTINIASNFRKRIKSFLHSLGDKLDTSAFAYGS